MFTSAGWPDCTGYGLRIRDLHWSHHVIVFVIKNMAVPYVARPRGRVKRERILAGKQVRFSRGLRRDADQYSGDLSWRCYEDVLPTALPRRWRFRGTRQEVMYCTRRRIENRSFDIGSYRWVIERKCRAIQTLPVSPEAFDVDILSILQLKLDQVNVYGMGIFR